MLKPDIVRLQHMVDAANEAISFVADKSKTELERDRALALALVKSIEIVVRQPAKSLVNCDPSHRTFHGQTSLLCAIVLSIAILT
jgi:hypothetical protein